MDAKTSSGYFRATTAQVQAHLHCDTWMMTSSFDCSTTPYFNSSVFGRTCPATDMLYTRYHLFSYNAARAQLTLIAKVLSLKVSFTFRMGPYEPLAMTPRICEYTGLVSYLSVAALMISPTVVQATWKWSGPGNLRSENSGRKRDTRAGICAAGVSAPSSGGSRVLGLGTGPGDGVWSDPTGREKSAEWPRLGVIETPMLDRNPWLSRRWAAAASLYIMEHE